MPYRLNSRDCSSGTRRHHHLSTTDNNNNKVLRICLFLSILVSLPSLSLGYKDHGWDEFLNPHRSAGHVFERLVVDPSTRRIFVGGVNHLYDISAHDLSVRVHEVTGPQEDSIHCKGRNDSCSSPRHKTNSFCKALAIHDKSSRLIECSNLFQGRCRIRNLHNISEVLLESGGPLINNDEKSSAVVFIGEGRSIRNVSSPILYVASTYVAGTYVEDVPAVAARSLEPDNTFEIPQTSPAYSTAISVERKFRSSYGISYINGFQVGDYAYFATLQGSNIGEDPLIQSRLVRVCSGDEKFHSYTEVPLECSDGQTNYNLLQDLYLAPAGYTLAADMNIPQGELLLFGVFVAGDRFSTQSRIPTTSSAICIYKLKGDVEDMFKQNILNCYKGNGTKQLPWFKSADRCEYTKFGWEQVQCGKDVNRVIGGTYPIKATPVFTRDDMQFSSIAVNTTHGNTVAFLGTQQGYLLKVLISSSRSAVLYEEIPITTPEPILQDLEFSEDGQHVFILTHNKLIKMETSNCDNEAPTCGSCLNKKDPYCGWCVKNNQCTKEDVCERSIPQTSTGWLEFQNNQCPNIQSVTPNKIQVTTADYLNVALENIGDAKTRFRCSFKFPNGKEVDMEHSRPVNGVLRCSTPPQSKIPHIPTNSSHLDAELRIIAEGLTIPIASSTFTFYDCNRHTTCSECAGSNFPCDWCLESNECVAGKLTEDKCRKQRIVNGLKRGHSLRNGPSNCPHIIAPKSKLYVAAGEKKNISVNVQNLDTSYMSEFRCEFKMGSTVHEKLATRTADDKIICDEMHFEHYGLGMVGGLAPVGFNVIWTSPLAPTPHVLDNIKGLSLEVYKCESLASNCGECLTLDSSNFNCGWCAPDNMCVRPRSCRATSSSDWLNSTQLCSNPVILDFSPKKGPFGGKTKLRIVGSNLGQKINDVMNAITVANVPCVVLPGDYRPASEVVCRTGPAIQDSKGPVVVRLRSDNPNFAAVSKQQFVYVNPVVSKIVPTRGPQSGGTDVTLFGHHLDAGSDVVVSFGNTNCEVQTRNSTQLVCRTSAAEEASGSLPLSISFDESYSKQVVPISFTYLQDPLVTGIDPENSIVAGGVLVDVKGQGFKLLQRPAMVFVNERNERSTGPPCTNVEDNFMTCLTPPLPHDVRIPAHFVSQSYAFDFDGAITEKRQMKVYRNPSIEPFKETRFYRPGENSLTISGKDLNDGATERDIKITVGGDECPLTAMANKIVTCRPPSTKPRLSGGLQPEIVVKIGSLSFTAGELSYDSPGMSSGAIMAILLLLFFVFIFLIGVVICYRRNTSSHKRQMKVLKGQMDTIEMKVATECKEAFAELQTSLNQYTADLPLGTPVVPFLDYKDYCARVLFPNNPHNHPVLRDLEVDSNKAGAIEAGLREFHKLLMNKTFFLTMVRTMESNKYFLGKDRVYVGSLLMVVLQEKMGYCTEMLKQLLRELIEKTVEKKFQPKILFRRSESVAERMLAAWFTFLMHDYLRNYAGKRLYDLYWGIKQQMEKGPQDACTLEARYSLSEEKLLRATFDYKELTVFIASDAGGYTHPDLPVRVLDCDTITQVKEKCLDTKYRTVRFSERPTAHDLDLEWRTGVNGRQILQDIDATSRLEPGGWKRTNTLAHYNVPNNAVLVLTARQNSLYNLSLLSERSEKSSMSLKNSPTMSRPWGGTTSSSNSKEVEIGFKSYHLVKPTEHGPSENQEKMVTEIYLTRLLMMKGTLQKFINDMLEAIFSTSRSSPLPPAIKYMFDFMDEQALEHGITDPEVVHAWKSNALPLRFWVNLIKNPHFVFDIQKPTKVEGCLSVVAQTLMDACSTQDHQLTKDSPSSKLLFAKDMYQYRDWVDSYYTEISRMPAISDQEMSNLLLEESRSHRGQFHVFSALNELYKYLDQYKDSIMEALESNEHAQGSRLPGRLQDMLALMEQDCGRTEYDSSTLGLGYNSNSRLMPRDRM